MQYWLMKSEPNVWSIEQQRKAESKGATWDGVRNYQAANNLRKMKMNDQCFFYHSNIGKEIVGIVKVIKTSFIDKTDKDKRFVAVQVRFFEQFDFPIPLQIIKKTKAISHLPLIKQSRLSVMPIDFKSWKYSIVADTLNIASKEWTWIKPLYPNMSQLSLLGDIHSEVSLEGTLSDLKLNLSLSRISKCIFIAESK